MTALTGEPCWIELFTPDTDAAAAFYGGLFGWTATDPDETFGGYRQFLRDGVPVAGLMVNDGSMISHASASDMLSALAASAHAWAP